MGFLIMGQKDSKKAAREQVAATRETAALATMDNNMAAKAAVDAQQAAIAQRIAQQAASELLSKPMESASVDLATDGDGSEEGDLISRRKATRTKYQSKGNRSSGLAV